MVSTSTPRPEDLLRGALASLPAEHIDHLLEEYLGLKRAYFESQFDACGLRAGRFCEVLLRILQHLAALPSVPYGTKVDNFSDATRALEKASRAAAPESVRLILPRAIEFVYTLRNKRAIGHVGGDVDANQIDASTIVRIVDWTLAELIRCVHSLSLDAAQALVNALAERDVQVVWRVGGAKRVLQQMRYTEQTLILLYSEITGSLRADTLFAWVEHSNITYYKRDVLRRLHSDRLVEYDEAQGNVTISPMGAQRVERQILPRMSALAKKA